MRLHWVTLITTLAIGASLIFLVIQGRQVQSQRNQGLRTFICYFESAVLAQPQTPSKQATAIRFFNGVLGKLHEPPCIN